MIRHRCLLAVLPFAWMLGCQGTVGEGPATTTSPASTVAVAPVATVAPATETATHKAFGHHGGPAAAFFRAADGLTLSASQKSSLASVEASLAADEDAAHAAMTAFHADLSAGVKAGALDTAKLTADGAAVEAAMTAHRIKQAAALVSLHDLLEPAQRTALVAAIHADRAEHESRMAEWKAKEGHGAHGDWQKRRLDELTSDLALDATQQQQIAGVLAQEKHPEHDGTMETRRLEMKQHDEAMLTAFAGATLNAADVQPKAQPEEALGGPMTGHMVSFVSQVLPLLRPDQREKLASSMDERLHHGPLQGPTGAPPGAPVE
jgi:LTXXQ motif family protein